MFRQEILAISIGVSSFLRSSAELSSSYSGFVLASISATVVLYFYYRDCFSSPATAALEGTKS